MLHDHNRTALLWSGVCDGCLAAIFPPRPGARDVVERELVAEGWEMDGSMVWCVACSRKRREVKLHDRRGRRRR